MPGPALAQPRLQGHQARPEPDELAQLPHRHEAGLLHVAVGVARLELPADLAPRVEELEVMPPGLRLELDDEGQVAQFHDQSGLLEGLAPRAVLHEFARLEPALGQRPAPALAHEQDLVAAQHDAAHADARVGQRALLAALLGGGRNRHGGRVGHLSGAQGGWPGRRAALCPVRAAAPPPASALPRALRSAALIFRHYTPSGARSLNRTCAL